MRIITLICVNIAFTLASVDRWSDSSVWELDEGKGRSYKVLSDPEGWPGKGDVPVTGMTRVNALAATHPSRTA